MNTKFYAENLLGEALYNDQFLKEDGCFQEIRRKKNNQFLRRNAFNMCQNYTIWQYQGILAQDVFCSFFF